MLQYQRKVMGKTIAYCGLACDDCPAFIATQADDRAALEEVAAKWSEQFNAPEITADAIMCDNCLSSDGRLSGYCTTCQIRACAQRYNVLNCAYCSHYADCAMLREFHAHAPAAKEKLEEIHNTL